MPIAPLPPATKTFIVPPRANIRSRSAELARNRLGDLGRGVFLDEVVCIREGVQLGAGEVRLPALDDARRSESAVPHPPDEQDRLLAQALRNPLRQLAEPRGRIEDLAREDGHPLASLR